LFHGFNGQILKVSTRATTSTRTSLNFGFWTKGNSAVFSPEELLQAVSLIYVT
jgi:hypothetical protein